MIAKAKVKKAIASAESHVDHLMGGTRHEKWGCRIGGLGRQSAAGFAASEFVYSDLAGEDEFGQSPNWNSVAPEQTGGSVTRDAGSDAWHPS